jgi:hypothetical protein
MAIVTVRFCCVFECIFDAARHPAITPPTYQSLTEIATPTRQYASSWETAQYDAVLQQIGGDETAMPGSGRGCHTGDINGPPISASIACHTAVALGDVKPRFCLDDIEEFVQSAPAAMHAGQADKAGVA